VKARLSPPRRIKLLLPILLAVSALSVGTAVATASNPIEGVWSFGGGSIAIQSLSDGSYQGTVVTATTFADCPHPVGEVLWTAMKEQSDGSFWGFHQWFHGAQCEVVSQLGQTAWRVLEDGGHTHYLLVCFSNPINNPGNATQPKIAPNGTATDDTYGCVKSALVSSLPTVEGEGSSGSGSGSSGSPQAKGGVLFSQTVLLPKAGVCVAQKKLQVKVKDPKYDPLKELLVKLNGKKKLADIKGNKQLGKAIVLKGLPSGTYKLSFQATTVLNQKLTGSRTYKSCTKGSGTIGLKKAQKGKGKKG
jgi:hypothetical protein